MRWRTVEYLLRWPLLVAVCSSAFLAVVSEEVITDDFSLEGIKPSDLSAVISEEVHEKEKTVNRTSELIKTIASVILRVQQRMALMDVKKHNLSEEVLETIANVSRIEERKANIQLQLSDVQNQVIDTIHKLIELRDTEEHELQEIRAAEEEFKKSKEERQKKLLITFNQLKWTRIIKEAAKTLAVVANDRLSKENELTRLKQEASSLRATLDRNNAVAAEHRSRVLRTTRLTVIATQLVKDFVRLHRHVQRFKKQLHSGSHMDVGEIGYVEATIEDSMNRITEYLEDGQFVRDAEGWGMRIAVFDTGALEKLGVVTDKETSDVLGIN